MYISNHILIPIICRYDETGSIIATTVCCAIGSIIAAFLTDMPFIIAPPTSVSIFLAVSMQQQGDYMYVYMCVHIQCIH